MSDVAYADGARDSSGKSLEMRDFSRFSRIVFLAADNPDRMLEATDVDETEIQGEKSGARDQPHHDERQLRTSDGNRVEDDFRGQVGHGLKCLIDGLVDAQWSPRRAFSDHRNLAKNGLEAHLVRKQERVSPRANPERRRVRD